MREDERKPRCGEEDKWRVEIELPEAMVQSFRHWWDTQGWWGFRAFYERTCGSESEWEQFMRHLCGEPPARKRPAVCGDPTEPKFP